jgi:hypothetical protein
MFKRKYKVSMLDSKWNPIKRNVKLDIIPKSDEYIWDSAKYYRVINVVHSIDKNHEIFIILEEYIPPTQEAVENV